MAFIYDSDSIRSADGPVFVTSTATPEWVSVSSNTFVKTPVVTSINLTYNKPTLGNYESLNYKPEIHARFMKHYYYKTLDSWLMDDINDILNYFTVSNDKVALINKLTDYDKNNIEKDTDKTAKLKADFIQKNILSKHMMLDILAKFVDQTEINWVDLPKNELFLKRHIKHSLKKIIKKLILKKSNSQ